MKEMQNASFLPRAGLIIIVAIATTACQPRVLPNRINPETLQDVQSLALDIRTESAEFNVDYQPDQLNLSIPVAAATAAQIAAMNTARNTNREAAVAGGIIGTFIGIQIAKNAYQARLQSAANEPVSPLKQNLEARDFHDRVANTLHESLERHLAAHYRVAAKGVAPDATLGVKLDVSLSPDLSSMHLRAEAVVRTSSSSRALPAYAREIDYFDVAVGDPARMDQAGIARLWIEEGGSLFWERLAASADSLARLISADLERDIFEGTPGGNAIRYENRRGLFYERGYLVDVAENRLLIRTLRGGLVSVPGRVVESNGTASP